MKEKIVLSCLILKQNSFKPLKQNMFTFTTKRFKCFRQFEKKAFRKNSKAKSEAKIVKQPPGVFYEKRCTYKFHKIYRKTSVPEHFLLKKRLWQRWFPVYFSNFLRTPRSSYQRCSLKKGVLRKGGRQTCNFIKKETLAQLFFSETCEISKNTSFIEHLRTTASERRYW